VASSDEGELSPDEIEALSVKALKKKAATVVSSLFFLLLPL